MRSSIPTLIVTSIVACACFAQPKNIVKNEGDLPRFTYKVTGNVADLLRPDSAAFKDFAANVQVDLESIFKNYQRQVHSAQVARSQIVVRGIGRAERTGPAHD